MRRHPTPHHHLHHHWRQTARRQTPATAARTSSPPSIAGCRRHATAPPRHPPRAACVTSPAIGAGNPAWIPATDGVAEDMRANPPVFPCVSRSEAFRGKFLICPNSEIHPPFGGCLPRRSPASSRHCSTRKPLRTADRPARYTGSASSRKRRETGEYAKGDRFAGGARPGKPRFPAAA